MEGGGVTVSAFLEANLLDRLQLAIAPVLIGEGRPAIGLAPHATFRDCRRLRYRVFRMGGDVLFDCDLEANADPPTGGWLWPSARAVNQVIAHHSPEHAELVPDPPLCQARLQSVAADA